MIPRMVLPYVCAGSVPFSVVTACYDMRVWSQKRTRRVGALPGGVGLRSARLVFLPSQPVPEFPPFFRERIEHVVRGGVFGVESEQMAVAISG